MQDAPHTAAPQEDPNVNIDVSKYNLGGYDPVVMNELANLPGVDKHWQIEALRRVDGLCNANLDNDAIMAGYLNLVNTLYYEMSSANKFSQVFMPVLKQFSFPGEILPTLEIAIIPGDSATDFVASKAEQNPRIRSFFSSYKKSHPEIKNMDAIALFNADKPKSLLEIDFTLGGLMRLGSAGVELTKMRWAGIKLISLFGSRNVDEAKVLATKMGGIWFNSSERLRSKIALQVGLNPTARDDAMSAAQINLEVRSGKEEM